MTPSTAYGNGARRLMTLAAAMLCAASLASSADAADAVTYAPRKILIVRAYSGAGVSPRDVAEASRVAGSILGSSGIDVSWTLCRLGGPADAAGSCSHALAPAEVVVRITNAPEPMERGVTSLGFTAIDPQGRRSVLSTVYLDRIGLVAARVKVDESLLAGRAIAHELGHLLLGTEGHSEHGLMRAMWSDASLRSRAIEDWTLSPADVAAIDGPQQALHVAVTTGGN
jgi:hypothetical protein